MEEEIKIKFEFKGKQYCKVSFQIFLLIIGTIAFSFIINEGFSNEKMNVDYSLANNPLLNFYKIIIKLLISEHNLVSALGISDVISTCTKDTSGRICQEYKSADCESWCLGSCIPSTRDKVSKCQPGTCYDPVEGTCQVGSAEIGCTDNGGKWFNDPYGNNIPECRMGCCLLGTNKEIATLTTEQQCNKKAAVIGAKKEFRVGVTNDLSCMSLASIQAEGACVFLSSTGKGNGCKFTKANECNQLRGKFYANYLCSNPDLNTSCIAQQKTDCFEVPGEGKAVYWVDSCGNKENIFDSNKAVSHNLGRVLAKSSSCQLNGMNRASCGNCNYLLGTTCKAKGNENVAFGEYICKDLSCNDKGKRRQNGESWCAYQTDIGEDTANNRATDPPGSRHYRKSCIDGEIKTEPCADYRNAICAEERIDANGKKISSAACRANLWQMCISVDLGESAMASTSNSPNAERVVTEDTSGTALGRQEFISNNCEKNPDCFLKYVNVPGKETQFSFPMCVPKYSPGFDTKDYGESAEQICGMANQDCTVTFVKEIDDWKCVSNCGCLGNAFAEEMNDLCMSMGDCGTEVNYIGDLTINHEVSKDKKAPIDDHLPTLTSGYLSGLKKCATPVEGKCAKPELEKYSSMVGGISGGYEVTDPSDLGMMGMVVPGVAGIIGMYGATYFAGSVGWVPTGTVVFANPALGAASGALAGAAIGFAITSLLIKYTGIGAGIGEAGTWALIGAGTAAGAIVGASMATGAGIGGGGAAATMAPAFFAIAVPIAWIVLVIVVIFIIVMAILGVGDTKEVHVKFQCSPWQAPTGGAKCGECGKGGFACGRYACHQLGQTCELINEGTGQELCINQGVNDVNPPIITAMNNLPIGFTYENQGNGVRIKSTETDNCIRAFTPLSMGILLNEPGQCRMDTDPSASFENMQYYFGASNLFLMNHSMIFPVPSVESLLDVPISVNKNVNITLYVKCQDSAGNKNVNPYMIGFCIKPGEDVTEPVVKGRSPGEWISHNSTSVIASVFLSEPSKCKWNTNDTNYELMANNLTCKTGSDEYEMLGWRCHTSFPIENDESLFFIRCKDQPWWEGINETKRNTNSRSYQFSLKRTPELKIDSVSVENKTFIAGSEPVSVEVIIGTSGGYNGAARCQYRIGENYIDFFQTLDRTHRQVFQTLTSGDKVLPLRCVDDVGNVAEKTVKFKVEIDTTPVNTTRVYSNAGTLNVITDEKGECAFSNKPSDENCGFDWQNATKMIGNELIHTASFDMQATYYIKCKDIFGNTKQGCNARVKAGVVQ